ncbi:MAG: hypothetical protein AAB367_00215 [Patescibacteria group bacterium]
MTDEDNIKPKFLTKDVAETATDRVIAMATRDFPLKRQDCHIVVLAPSMEQDSMWPNYNITPFVLYEKSVGARSEWQHSYDVIARRKAAQLWQERNDGRTDCMPHLLFPGDTPYWGGVERDGIVVACSGFQAWFDKMVAGMIADACIALAYNLWVESDDKRKGLDFLSRF